MSLIDFNKLAQEYNLDQDDFGFSAVSEEDYNKQVVNEVAITKPVNWYQISMSAQQLEWDNLRKDYAYKITFSVSPKLSISGEKWEDAIKPDIVLEYEDYGNTYLKFVIATEEDLKDAERAVEEYRNAGFTGHVYLMPVGGVERVYSLNNRAVAEMAMRKGWRYSDRLQVPLFQNEWGT